MHWPCSLQHLDMAFVDVQSTTPGSTCDPRALAAQQSERVIWAWPMGGSSEGQAAAGDAANYGALWRAFTCRFLQQQTITDTSDDLRYQPM